MMFNFEPGMRYYHIPNLPMTEVCTYHSPELWKKKNKFLLFKIWGGDQQDDLMGKSGNVSLISGIHMVGKKGLLTQIVLCPLHTKKN